MITPLRNNVIVHRHEEADKQLFGTNLALPDQVQNKNQVSMITDAGEGVLHMHPGDTVITKRLDENAPMVASLGDGKWLIDESLVFMRLSYEENEDGEHYMVYEPFGRRVLVERMIGEKKTKSGLVIPDHVEYTEQTPWARVISWGGLVDGLSYGDYVYVEWSSAILELGKGGASDNYYALVPFEGIRFMSDASPDEGKVSADDRPPSQSELKYRKRYSKKYQPKKS